jgi:protein subunit release factor A
MPVERDKKLLFSVTVKDIQVETFAVSGAGGQHKDRKRSGVRMRHPPSGAVAEARDARDQLTNRRNAFVKLTETKAFQAWLKKETARRLQQETVEERVEKMMQPGNLKVEVRNEEGRWTDVHD